MSKTNRMYLVTGAAGFLGSTVCRKLVEKNERVRAFVLEGDKSAKYLPGEVEISYGDLCNKEDLERFFETPEGTEVIVLHIASIVTVNPHYSQKVMDVNVGGTENIIEMCKEHNVSKLVYCSSTAANFIAKILEKKAKKTGKKPLMTTFSVYNLARNNRFDSSKASKELGYTTRSYRETIRDEIRWLKETGKIA